MKKFVLFTALLVVLCSGFASAQTVLRDVDEIFATKDVHAYDAKNEYFTDGKIVVVLTSCRWKGLGDSYAAETYRHSIGERISAITNYLYSHKFDRKEVNTVGYPVTISIISERWLSESKHHPFTSIECNGNASWHKDIENDPDSSFVTKKYEEAFDRLFTSCRDGKAVK